MDLNLFLRLRVGSGFDIHPLSLNPARKFMLGGIQVDSSNGPEGHSDADVVCHALADSILGSIGMGGLGDHFKDNDERWKNIDSVFLLKKCYEMFLDRGYLLVNADVTVILQRPRIAEFLGLMSQNMTTVLQAPVSVKAKSAEKVGSLGAGDAVVCIASTLAYKATD